MLSGSIALAPWLELCALVDLAFLQFRRNFGNRRSHEVLGYYGLCLRDCRNGG